MMEYPKLFAPEYGKVYENRGGGTYRCIDRTAWRENTARAWMQNTRSGWAFTAVGCRMYQDGTIEWDYSTGGEFLPIKTEANL